MPSTLSRQKGHANPETWSRDTSLCYYGDEEKVFDIIIIIIMSTYTKSNLLFVSRNIFFPASLRRLRSGKIFGKGSI